MQGVKHPGSSSRRQFSKQEVKSLQVAWQDILRNVRTSSPQSSPGGASTKKNEQPSIPLTVDEEEDNIRVRASKCLLHTMFRLPRAELLEYRRRSREIKRAVPKVLPWLKQVPCAGVKPVTFPEEEPEPEPPKRSDTDIYCSGVLDRLHADIRSLPKLGLRYRQLVVDEDAGESIDGCNSLLKALGPKRVPVLGSKKTKRELVTTDKFQRCLRRTYPSRIKLLRMFAENAYDKIGYSQFCVIIKDLDFYDETQNTANLFYSIDTDGSGFISKEEIIAIYDAADTSLAAVNVVSKVASKSMFKVKQKREETQLLKELEN